MDYNHLDVYACRIIVPGMSDIYPADDLIYANNNMGMDWREILLIYHTIIMMLKLRMKRRTKNAW